MKFIEYTKPKEIKDYLLNVLGRTGGISKDKTCLYHYSSIDSVASIIKSKSMWLGNTENMNDYLEGEFIQSAGEDRNLLFASFSKVEENIAMYKMYAPNPNGVMIILPYSVAEKIVKEQTDSKGATNDALIVKDNSVTNEKLSARLYWSSVCYKNLHDDMISVGTVINNNIGNPLDEPELAGFIKLHGWKYEEEVRLCAMAERPLSKNERIALKLYDGFEKDIVIVTGPGFDKEKNKKTISALKRKGVRIQSSEYEGLIDIGSDNTSFYKEEIERLKKENSELKEKINETVSNSIQSFPEKSRPSIESCYLLIYAAEIGSGQIISAKTLGMKGVISVSNYNFIETNSPREIAIWQEAFDDLKVLGWARSEKKTNDYEIIRLTGSGFEKAEEINYSMKIDTSKDPKEEYKKRDTYR